MSRRNDGAPMDDGERDTWLREALRHAPDADAAPPRDLSDTILAQARAAARVGATRAPAPRSRNPVVVLWNWLARPPVAAGFASIMAATLVGLMWWDRPMDETLPYRFDSRAARSRPQTAEPSSAAQSAQQANRDVAANLDIARQARAPASTAPAAALQAPPSPSVAAIPQAQPDARLRDEGPMPGADRSTANAAKVLTPQAPPPPANTMPLEAKEQRRKLESNNAAALADRAAPKPAPFPRAEESATIAAAPPAKKTDSDAKDAKGGDGAGTTPADALSPGDAALAKSRAAATSPVAPAEPSRAQPPAAFGRERANELARTSPSAAAENEVAKRAGAAGAMSQATPAPAAAPTMQAAAPAGAAPPALRDSASAGGEREKQASAFPPPAAKPRGELASPPREGAAAAPLAPFLAAIASEPSRWSRSTAAGGVVALEPGWRDWLTQLDAAARGRWQPIGPANAREGDAATTLRLVDGGRTTAVVRLDGTTVRVDAVDRGERWQATLTPAAAEQLRASAEQLGR